MMLVFSTAIRALQMVKAVGEDTFQPRIGLKQDTEWRQTHL